MGQDEIIAAFKQFPHGIVTQKELKEELKVRWIGAQCMRALETKGIIKRIGIVKGGRPVYQLVGKPEEKLIIN